MTPPPHPSLQPVTLSLPRGVARLEPLSLDHAQPLARAASGPAIWKYIPPPYGGAHDLPSMRALIERALAAQDSGAELPFVIIHAPTGQPVGSTRYLDIQPAHRALEIGATWLGPAWQRTSINTECKYLLLRHAFETLWPATASPSASSSSLVSSVSSSPAFSSSSSGAVRVQLKCDARNTPSQAAILRLGATYEGILRKHRVLPDGFIRDTVYFSIIQTEWPAVKRRLEARLSNITRTT